MKNLSYYLIYNELRKLTMYQRLVFFIALFLCALIMAIPIATYMSGDAMAEIGSVNEVRSAGAEGRVVQNHEMVLKLPDTVISRLEPSPWWETPLIIALAAILVSGISGWISVKVANRTIDGQLANQRILLNYQEELNLINAKLNNFYGPFLAIDKASNALWTKFCEVNHRHIHPDSFFIKDDKGEKSDLCEELLQDYMRVMKEIFAPLNQQRKDLIITEAALIDINVSEEFPQQLIDLVTHASELCSIMRRWDDQQFKYNAKSVFEEKGRSAFYPEFQFPAELDKYVEDKWMELNKKKSYISNKLETGK